MIVGPPVHIPAPIGVRELAAKLHVGEGTVRRKVKAGIWQSVIVEGCIRFTSAVVDEIVAERRTAATEAEKNDD